MKAKDKEKTLGRILSGIDMATVKKWDPPKGLIGFCEEIGMKDDTILSQRRLMRIGNKYGLWGKWIILKAITEKGLWDDDIVSLLVSGDFKDLEEELATLIIRNKRVLVPSKAVALVRQLRGYMIEFFRAIKAFVDLPGEQVYNLLREIEKPFGWERQVADIMISRRGDIGPGRLCTLVEELIIGDIEQFERVIRECGIKGKRRERLETLLRKKHNFPEPLPIEQRVVF